MIFQIDFKSGTPVYLQLVDQIRYAAASGTLKSGEPLPGVKRSLARITNLEIEARPSGSAFDACRNVQHVMLSDWGF